MFPADIVDYGKSNIGGRSGPEALEETSNHVSADGLAMNACAATCNHCDCGGCYHHNSSAVSLGEG